MAPPELGVFQGSSFVETAFRPVKRSVSGDTVAAPPAAGDEERKERNTGDETENEGARWKAPVIILGEWQGGGCDVEQDAVSLNGHDLIVLQEGGEFDRKHVAGFIVMDGAPIRVHVVALGTGEVLVFLLAFGGANEVEFSLKTRSEQGGGEIVVAHVSGEDDGACRGPGKAVEVVETVDFPVDEFQP